MFHKSQSGSSRIWVVLLAALAGASTLFVTMPAHASPDECYFVADKGNYPDDKDLLASGTLTRGASGPVGETKINFTGTLDIEALASDPNDPNFELWAVDHDRLGKLNKATAAFTPVSANHLGSGSGAAGNKSFSNSDGLAFDPSTTPSTLYATIRFEEDADLLIQVNPSTGQHVPDAFPGGDDYVVVGDLGMGLHNVDDIVFDGSRMLGIINERGGSDSHLVEINKTTGAVTNIGDTGQVPDPTLGPPDDIEGLAIGPSGLWGLNGKAFPTTSSYVWEIDKTNGKTTNPRLIGDGARDWEGFTCRANAPPPGVVVRKFDDQNGNAVRDQGEPGLPGWRIHVVAADGSEQIITTGPDGEASVVLTPGHYLACEELQPGWAQTAPAVGADCTGHTHGDTIVPGPRGYDFDFPTGPGFELEFGNTRCVSQPAVSKNARAFGLRADLLGGGILPATPDIGPTPDSDGPPPYELLSIPNVLDPTSPPLVSLLSVSEAEDANSTTATATTAAVDLNIPGLAALRVQAEAVKAQSRSYLELGGASSSSAGSTIANLRIGGTQYGDVSEPLTVVINDPLNPGTPFIEVHVLERVRRDAAAGIVQSFPGLSKSGLDVNGIHVVVHDLALTPIDETSDIIVAHASTDIAFTAVRNCPSLSGRAYVAQLFNVNPDLAHAMVGEVVLPSTGGEDSEHLADVDVGTVLTADAASTSTNGAVTLGPDGGTATSRAQIAHADVAGLVEATLIQADAAATLLPDGTTALAGDTIIAELHILGTDVCGALGLSSTCHPAPNTVFIDLPVLKVVLNEQILDADGRGLTVNAVHIWVLGAVPGSTLPIGAEVIISSAHADVHPAA
jgi:hypothetical protein